MSFAMKLTQAEIDAMSMNEKLALSEALWCSIASVSEGPPLPQWHKDVLDERLQNEATDSDDWQSVRRRIERT